MNIDPSNSASHLYAKNVAANNVGKNAGSAKAAAGNVSYDKAELNALEKLRSEPEIRPEVVAKGKELLNDPKFPSADAINHIAKLIQPFADDE